MKIVIDAKKQGIPIFTRGSGKTNLRMTLFLAWVESYRTGKPVEIEYGMKVVDISDYK